MDKSARDAEDPKDQARKLRDVYLMYCRQFLADPVFLKVFSQVPDRIFLSNIKDLRENDLHALLSPFHRHSLLKAIEIWSTPLSLTSLLFLPFSLSKCSRAITKLCLVNCSIDSPEKVDRLCECIAKSCSLRELVLDFNPLGSLASKVIATIEANQVWSHSYVPPELLQLHEKTAGADRLIASSAGKEKPKSAKSRPTSGRAGSGKDKKIKGKKSRPGSSAAAPLLPELRLSLRGCNLDSQVAADIKRLLIKNPSIKDINLSQNCLGPQGLLHLIDAFHENTRLENIDLSYNHFGIGSFPSRYANYLASLPVSPPKAPTQRRGTVTAISKIQATANTTNIKCIPITSSSSSANITSPHVPTGMQLVETLCNALRSIPNLTNINIQGNHFTPFQYDAFTKLLNDRKAAPVPLPDQPLLPASPLTMQVSERGPKLGFVKVHEINAQILKMRSKKGKKKGKAKKA